MHPQEGHPGLEPPGQEGPYNTIVWGVFLASSVLVLLITLAKYQF